MNAVFYKEPIIITIAYFGLYYCFVFGQAAVTFYLFANQKTDAPKLSLNQVRYNSPHKLSLTAQRTTGNTLEQMGPFLAAIWLNALFVSRINSFTMGIVYISFRSIYPFCFYKGGPWLLLSTVPGYIVIFTLLAQVAFKSVGY